MLKLGLTIMTPLNALIKACGLSNKQICDYFNLDKKLLISWIRGLVPTPISVILQLSEQLNLIKAHADLLEMKISTDTNKTKWHNIKIPRNDREAQKLGFFYKSCSDIAFGHMIASLDPHEVSRIIVEINGRIIAPEKDLAIFTPKDK